MRFIHTSDLHIGKPLHNLRERYHECASVLDELVLYATTENIDLIIVAGDLFETTNPSAEAEKLAYDFFYRLSKAEIPVAVIAGNHDSADRFDGRTELFSLAGINVAGRPQKGQSWKYVTKKGQLAIVVPVPFLPNQYFLKGDSIFQMDQSEMKMTYSEKIGRVIDILSSEFRPDAVNILVSHLYLQGAIPSNSERMIETTDAFAVSAPAIPANATYCCLGHIHKQQKLETARIPTYYSGSPMRMDFGEEKDAKGFLVIEANPGKPPIVEAIPFTSTRELHTLIVPLEELDKRAPDFSREVGNGYARVHVQHHEPVPQLGEIVKRVIPQAVICKFISTRPEDMITETKHLDIGILSNPIEMFSEFYRDQTGKDPDDDLKRALSRVLEDVRNASC